MKRDETWTAEEYGRSHESRVGVLLADGMVPKPVYFDSDSGGFGWEVTHWSLYDGQGPDSPRPQAHSLRGECSCGWTGTPGTLDPTAA
ncbi:hypothetical protein ABZ924_30395 [Streptomyces sp. NPDC046876]|uniref:hypothetical protein n=1 Tax=Streptomyces sp. NPDC046876 TaxID=3155616 RepID=UPI0033F97A70